ncbi:hypothetical protein DY000_02012550, partial [Brassica cretica]
DVKITEISTLEKFFQERIIMAGPEIWGHVVVSMTGPVNNMPHANPELLVTPFPLHETKERSLLLPALIPTSPSRLKLFASSTI